MNEEQIRLLERIDRLVGEVGDLREGIRRAVSIVEADPAMSLIRVRKVLEQIVRETFEKRVGEPAGTRPMENLLQRIIKDELLPRNLAPYANGIRELGNFGAHGAHDDVTSDDLFRSLSMLLPILEWYFATQRGPDPAAALGRDKERVNEYAKAGAQQITTPMPPPIATPPVPNRVPWKLAALLDRRLITELTVLLANSRGGSRIKSELPGLLEQGLVLYDEFLIETGYSSVVSPLLNDMKESLRNALVPISAPRTPLPEDFRFALEDDAEQWGADPHFQLIVSRYVRDRRTGTSATADAIDYLQHALSVARTFDAAIVPHPARWPLFRHVMENCVWATTEAFANSAIRLPADPFALNPALPGDRRQRVAQLTERLGEAGPAALSLFRYGPMAHPFARGILSRYRAQVLEGFGAFAYEFLVPTGELA